MSNGNKIHDFKNIGHRTLAQMAQEIHKDPVPALTRIKSEADRNEHDKIIDAEVVETSPKKQEATKGPAKLEKQFGRILLFRPTGEVVTITQENVGRSYDGTVIHEVISREGKVFLASTKQLKERV